MTNLHFGTSTNTTMYTTSLCLKRNDSQNFKSNFCKNFFPGVYVIGTTCDN